MVNINKVNISIILALIIVISSFCGCFGNQKIFSNPEYEKYTKKVSSKYGEVYYTSSVGKGYAIKLARYLDTVAYDGYTAFLDYENGVFEVRLLTIFDDASQITPIDDASFTGLKVKLVVYVFGGTPVELKLINENGDVIKSY